VYINDLVINTDGTPVPSTPTIRTDSLTLNQLNQYDWGGKFGYERLNVPMLEDSLKLAAIYGLGVTLDFKFEPNDNDIDTICTMLAKTANNDVIIAPVPIQTMVKFSAKSKYISYYFCGTSQQIEDNVYWWNKLKSAYNRVYIQYAPFGDPPTDSFINLCAANDLYLYMTPIEGLNELVSFGFDKGIKLFECHYITNIKDAIRGYADSLIDA
jgi:hypothetical protein